MFFLAEEREFIRFDQICLWKCIAWMFLQADIILAIYLPLDVLVIYLVLKFPHCLYSLIAILVLPFLNFYFINPFHCIVIFPVLSIHLVFIRNIFFICLAFALFISSVLINKTLFKLASRKKTSKSEKGHFFTFSLSLHTCWTRA